MIGPGRTFGLQIESHPVGCFECCFGRAIGMEPHMVESKAAGDAKEPFPACFVYGCVAGEREFAVLDGAAEMDRVAVDSEVGALGFEFAHAEFDGAGRAIIWAPA